MGATGTTKKPSRRPVGATAPSIAVVESAAQSTAAPTIAEFDGDVTAIILSERETKLDIYWQYVTWRYRQANELLVRTMQWFAQSGQAMPESFGNSATMAQAEKRIESLAAKGAPETFAAADSYLNRMREYLAKCRGEAV